MVRGGDGGGGPVVEALSLTLCTILASRVLLLLAADQIVLDEDRMLYDGDRCNLKNGMDGICRPANECRWVMDRTQPAQDLVTCSFNLSLPIVCCPAVAQTQMGTTNALLKGGLRKRISVAQCEQFPNMTGLSDHILNGVAAQFGEFPHMAALGYGAPDGPDASSPALFRCAASLISTRYLLTAAHCVSERPVFARLGVLELQPARVVDQPLDILIRNVTPHPEYNFVTYHNDIALLELAEPVPADWPFIDPICLYPNLTTTGGPQDPTEPGRTYSIQGWGTQMPGDTELALRLMKANLTIVERVACDGSWPKSRRKPDGLHRSQLCAIGRNERNVTVADSCQGDSGGPLQVNLDGRHYLVGIISYGMPCGSTVPGIYTEVAQYLDWIEPIVWPRAS